MKCLTLCCALFLGLSHTGAADTLRLNEGRMLDAAARQVLTTLQARSFRSGREFCGLLGRNENGAIISTQPRRGNADTCLPYQFRTKGVVPLASFHTHGAYDHEADSEVPSYEDLDADMKEGLVGFIATPGGRFWVNLPQEGLTRQLCGLRCLPQDRHFNQGDWGLIRKTYTLRQLKQRRQLY
ncbi:DUF4329 domain-containing protein [Litoreibacter janthinus]|uniref:DUF4329 domain-containing protein n=1 Tax=Litoreibacter janthinus TaxID=670154 RepID=A0A1I6GWK2_9RHOB|nr:DUF4329 domain-containing protein [Litoreibacter janthinus]SFR46605.1 protein of unknown function [Litoreibacter janthinus]